MTEDKHQKRTPISELGEFGLIEKLTKSFKLNQSSSRLGIGDDAALISPKKSEQLVVSTDLLVEGIHFDLTYMPIKHLGYKAVMVNLSDIYAMNALATQITVSIAVSNRFPVEALEELYQGIAKACDLYQVDLVGGDTSSSNKGLIISITAIGFAKKSDITTRKGAKPNDLLVISGDVGNAYMGYQILERDKQVFKANPNNQPELDKYTYLIERQLKPEARKDIVLLLKSLEIKPTAMIDVSDGLSSEVLHLSKASAVGCNLYEEKIPLDPQLITACEEFKLNSTIPALSGGEDYELLFTIDQKDYPKIKGNPNLSVIGHITDKNEGNNLITKANTKIPLKAQGWGAIT